MFRHLKGFIAYQIETTFIDQSKQLFYQPI